MEPETKPAPDADVIDVEQELSDLRRSSGMLLVGLVMLSVTFTTFLWLQSRRAGYDLRALRNQAQQVQEASRREGAAAENFVRSLIQYGQTHRDFQQVLDKYHIRLATNAGPTGAGPVPASR